MLDARIGVEDEFFLAFSPEREDPGNVSFSTATIPKVVGGDGAARFGWERRAATPGARREGDAPELERDFLDDLNPASKRTITAQLEPALKNARPEERFQFERHGYFVADRKDHGNGKIVFNRTVTLKDSWGK